MFKGVEIPTDLQPVDWGEIGEDLFTKNYSRPKGLRDNAKESWADMWKRVVNGNCEFVPERYIEHGEPEALFRLGYTFSILPGGRHLYCTGVIGRPYISNCWASGWDKSDFSRHFTFAFMRLMEGGGVGANYSNSYLASYTAVPTRVSLHVICDPDHKDYEQIKPFLSEKYSADWRGAVQVPDNREGWADTLEKLLNGHYSKFELHGGDLVVDVSQIRPSGTKLKSFGGTASGPQSFIIMLVNVNRIMNEHKGKKPDTVMCMEIDHEVAQCVVSGNVRRSARMSMKHWKDPDIIRFIKLKKESASHWSTNISVIVDKHFFQDLRNKDKRAHQIMRLIASGALKNGEPGIFNITKAQEGELFTVYCTNPCGEIPMPEWGCCNLASLNLSKFSMNEAGLMEAARLLTRFLIRATFAECKDPLAQKVIDRDRRIGLGITGFADWLALEGAKFSMFPSDHHHKQILRNVAKTVRETARKYAFDLRIPEPIKVTCAAPTGTTAKLVGCSEGIQPILFRYFKRRVIYCRTDPAQQKLIDQARKDGLEVVKHVKEANSDVVTYICRARILDQVQDGALIQEAGEISIDDCLDVQKAVQDVYADNAISFTVNINQRKTTKDDIMRVIQAFGPYIKGTTIMPEVTGYDHMPYERISKEAYEAAPVRQSATGVADCKNGVCATVGHATQD